MLTMRALAAALALSAASLSIPAAAQFSDTYNFFKAVKDKDGPKANQIMTQPGSTVLTMREGDSGDQALHIVTRRRDLGWMNLLLSRGAPVDGRNVQGETPLIVAAGAGFVDGVQLLIARKANVNLASPRGETPLIKAVQLRDMQSVRYLMEAGANPDQRDNVAGLSARDYAGQDRRSAAILRLITEAGAPKKAAATVGP